MRVHPLYVLHIEEMTKAGIHKFGGDKEQSNIFYFFLYLFTGRCGSSCLDFGENYLAWDAPGVGRFILFMLLQSLVFIILTLAIDYNLFKRLAAYAKVRIK